MLCVLSFASSNALTASRSGNWPLINGRTSTRRVDLVVTELAVIAFPDGNATLVETAPGVSTVQVLDATEAPLVVPAQVPVMPI